MAVAVVVDRLGVVKATLLDAVTGGANDGEWIDVSTLRTFDVEVTGITTATVQIRLSYADAKPADNTHGEQAGTDVTSDQVVNVVDMNPKWVKAYLSSWTSGTITARLRGRNR